MKGGDYLVSPGNFDLVRAKVALLADWPQKDYRLLDILRESQHEALLDGLVRARAADMYGPRKKTQASGEAFQSAFKDARTQLGAILDEREAVARHERAVDMAHAAGAGIKGLKPYEVTELVKRIERARFPEEQEALAQAFTQQHNDPTRYGPVRHSVTHNVALEDHRVAVWRRIIGHLVSLSTDEAFIKAVDARFEPWLAKEVRSEAFTMPTAPYAHQSVASFEKNVAPLPTREGVREGVIEGGK